MIRETITMLVSNCGGYEPGMLVNISGLQKTLRKIRGKYQVLAVNNGIVTLRKAGFWTRIMDCIWKAIEKLDCLLGKRAT